MFAMTHLEQSLPRSVECPLQINNFPVLLLIIILHIIQWYYMLGGGYYEAVVRVITIGRGFVLRKTMV